MLERDEEFIGRICETFGLEPLENQEGDKNRGKESQAKKSKNRKEPMKNNAGGYIDHLKN